MAVIKIPTQYLVRQDEDFITIDVPDNLLVNGQQNPSLLADRVRDKLLALNLTEDDVDNAVTWARQVD